MTVCTCETKDDSTLSQALHLLNGKTVHQKIVDGKLVERWLEVGIPTRDIIERLFMRCLARLPSEAENATVQQLLTDHQEAEVLQDLFWSLINSPEFSLNH